MTVEDIESGMVLNWQSESWPDQSSRWIVLEELEHWSDDQKKFNIFCMYSTATRSSGINVSTIYTFHRENIHRFSIHSQI